MNVNMLTKTRELDANWAPSRMNLATFKLLGYLMLRRKESVAPPRDKFILNMTPQQNSLEAFTLSALYYLHVWMFAQAGLNSLTPLDGKELLLFSILMAVPLFLLFQLIILGLLIMFDLLKKVLPFPVSHLRWNSALFLLIPTLTALVLIRSEGWVAYFAYSWVVLFALNGICSLIVRVLRAEIRVVEERYQ